VTLACIMTTIITTALSYAMHGLFDRDEKNLEKVHVAEKQRTEFFSALSHEIRTPLNGILGMSGLLLKTELNDQQRQYAQIVTDCSHNLMDVMSNVMEISQIDNDRMQLQSVPFNVHDMVRELANHYRAEIDDDSLSINVHIAANVPANFYADAKRIRMVLDHLIISTNAISMSFMTASVSLISPCLASTKAQGWASRFVKKLSSLWAAQSMWLVKSALARPSTLT